MPEPLTLAASTTVPAAAGSGIGMGQILQGLMSAGGPIAGGLISNTLNQKNIQKQIDFQREAMTHGISWRVQDAKNAGLHPLFALGANIPMPSPMILGDQLGPALAEAGQNLGKLVGESMSPVDKQRAWLEMKLAAGQLRESDARAALLEQEFQSKANPANTGLGVQPEVGPMGQVPNVPGGVGMIDVEAAKVTSPKAGAPGISAGVNPSYEVRMLANGFPIVLPASAGEAPEEIISEMNPVAWAGLLARNQRFWGGEWAWDFAKMRYGGIKNEKHYDVRGKKLKDF